MFPAAPIGALDTPVLFIDDPGCARDETYECEGEAHVGRDQKHYEHVQWLGGERPCGDAHDENDRAGQYEQKQILFSLCHVH